MARRSRRKGLAKGEGERGRGLNSSAVEQARRNVSGGVRADRQSGREVKREVRLGREARRSSRVRGLGDGVGDAVSGATRIDKAARSRAGELTSDVAEGFRTERVAASEREVERRHSSEVFGFDGGSVEDAILSDCLHVWEKASVGPLGCAVANGQGERIMFCFFCEGIIESCVNCKGFHLVDRGLGGAAMMPELVDEAWTIGRGCVGEGGREVPVPTVVFDIGGPQEFARYSSVEYQLETLEEVCEGDPASHPAWERLQALQRRRPTACELESFDGYGR